MEKQIINDYLNNFLSNHELSVKYGLHRVTIQRVLKKNGIDLRKKTPKLKVNHNFFSEYNEFSCYWAGFILADGYVRTNKRNTLVIKLKKDDNVHLENFKRDIEYIGDVKIKNNYSVLTISSSKIINDLKENFDITTKKSLTCFVSEKIPLIYMKHYIRGYFDGDGSITKTTTETISFLGTEKTLNYIRNYFFSYCKIKLRSKDIPQITKNKNICAIFYSGISAYKILKFLYENSNRFLNRKFFLYNKIKEKYEF